MNQPEDKIITAVQNWQDAMKVELAYKLQAAYVEYGTDFVKLAEAALSVMDEWE